MTSTPSGAQVLVDGVDKGLTPMQHLQLPARQAGAPGAAARGLQAVGCRGRGHPLDAASAAGGAAARAGAGVARSEPAGATVYANGQPIGTTPATWTTLPGAPVTLTFKLKGYHPQEKQITPGQQNVAEANLVREKSSGKTTGGESAPAIKMNR